MITHHSMLIIALLYIEWATKNCLTELNSVVPAIVAHRDDEDDTNLEIDVNLTKDHVICIPF